MHMIQRLLASLPRKSAMPIVAALAAYYIGGKYGAPDMYINTVDGVFAQAGDLIGSLTGGEGATTADG